MVNQMWITSNPLNTGISAGQVNWGTSVMGMAGTGGQTSPQWTPFEGVRISFRKKSRFMKSLSNCVNGKVSPEYPPKEVNNYFRDQSLDGLLPAMNFNPLYNGRPRREVLSLLLCSPSPMKFFHQYIYFTYGLVTLEPAICNRRKARARLSYTGLELLDYWSEKYPKFKPFVDAYVTKKARKEIAIDAVGYKMGILPSRFIAMQALHEKEKNMNRDTPNTRRFRDRYMRQRAAQYAALQQAQQYHQQQQTGAIMPQWMQQQLVNQYNNVVQQNNTPTPIQPIHPSSVWVGDDNTSTATSSLGSAIGRLLGRK